MLLRKSAMQMHGAFCSLIQYNQTIISQHHQSEVRLSSAVARSCGGVFLSILRKVTGSMIQPSISSLRSTTGIRG